MAGDVSSARAGAHDLASCSQLAYLLLLPRSRNHGRRYWQVGQWAALCVVLDYGAQLLTLSAPTDGPVLSQTELYLLRPELELHPILTGSDGSFHLVMNMQTGAFNVKSYCARLT